MSYLFRWVRSNQSLATRSTALLRNGSILETSQMPTSLSNIKQLYQVMPAQSISTTTPALMTQTQGNQPPKKDDIKYVIKFKELDVKGIFKQFYSLYGPLFVVCHIGIGLVSLGFFCSLTYFAIDLNQFIPDFVYQKVGVAMANMTGTGGKFVLAYAVHKAILPLRLGGAIYLTRFLAKYFRRGKPKS